MKTLILLLACVAAANAVSYYSCPNRYTPKIFWQLPHSSCFSYKVFYCRAWFSACSYADVLKIYPGEDCAKMTEDEFRTDCEGKLSAKETEISDEIDGKKTEWETALGERVAACISDFRGKVEEYTDNFIANLDDENEKEAIRAEGEECIEDYTEKVNDMKDDAVTDYCDAVNKIKEKIAKLHEDMLERAVEAYQTREEKIIEFGEQFDERVQCYVERFKTIMSQTNEKRVESYRCQLERVLESELIDSVVTEYETALAAELETKCVEYETELMSYKEDMIEHYRCAYQIITYSGCLSFNRRSFSCYCQRLGNWWSFTCDRTISCFKFVKYNYCWTKGQFCNLIECEVDDVVIPVETVDEELKERVTEAMVKAEASRDAWKEDWPASRAAAIEAFDKIVSERHSLLLEACRAAYLCKYGTISEEQQSKIDAYEDDLDERKADALEDYEKCLDDRFDAGCEWFEKSLEKYEERITCIADRILACYTACIEKREEKINEYYTALEERRIEQREKLVTRLGEISECKVEQFTKLLTFYHGDGADWTNPVSALLGEYSGIVAGEETAILDDFDCYWDALIPRLLEHYVCSYKCNVNVEFKVPEFCPANWYIVKPTSHCYGYKFNYFKRCYSYSIHYCNGAYTWCA